MIKQDRHAACACFDKILQEQIVSQAGDSKCFFFRIMNYAN